MSAGAPPAPAAQQPRQVAATVEELQQVELDRDRDVGGAPGVEHHLALEHA
jgi:hypothetical protein